MKSNGSVKSATYTYDSVGNRLKKGTDGEVTEYIYDAANRLTNAGGVVYDWDANGNLLDDGERAYTYDYANRLIQVISGTFTTTFTYNGDGHRMAKTENGVTTNYVVAVFGLSQVLVETTGGSTTRYVYGHDLLAEYDGTEWTYHLNDGLGSVRQLADASGDVTFAQAYTPFGVPLWSEENGSTGYGFTGERWEAYAELLFLRARYYEPGTGRFIQRDVWDGDSQQPQSLHPYSYVQNNAPNWIDPTGLTPDYQPDLPNHRDLTLWLYNEIRQNSDSIMFVALASCEGSLHLPVRSGPTQRGLCLLRIEPSGTSSIRFETN